MWFRVPPRPVDALITLLMAALFQILILSSKISAVKLFRKEGDIADGAARHFIGHGMLIGIGFLMSLVLFIMGLLNLLTVKEQDKKQFHKIIFWGYGLVLGLIVALSLELFYFLSGMARFE